MSEVFSTRCTHQSRGDVIVTHLRVLRVAFQGISFSCELFSYIVYTLRQADGRVKSVRQGSGAAVSVVNDDDDGMRPMAYNIRLDFILVSTRFQS